MEVAGGDRGRYDACDQMITVENEAGNTVNFFVSADTFVVDYATMYESMPVTVFYNGNAAAPLIYPPQYVAAVVAPQQEGQMVFVGYFNNLLMSSDQSLKLNLAPTTQVVTTNNQTFMGNPGNHTLVVLYSQTTRSIPAQTTPEKIIVLCGQ
ncbi:hypothetical protein DXA36_20945 [Eisenbergiella sp. OF01-20]|nr:hypothetical protein DXA36_20945 [Eisenbergiella sp. OF01-20]